MKIEWLYEAQMEYRELLSYYRNTVGTPAARKFSDSILGAVNRLADFPEMGMLKEGKYYTAVITGGGCGIANIEVPDNEKVIVKSSGSSYLSQSLSLQKVSRAGASAPAVIENFCRAMGINDELIDKIKASMKTNNLFFLILNPPFHKLY